MNVKEIIPQIVDTVRYNKKYLSKEKPYIEFDTEIYSSKGGNKEWYTFNFYGNKFISPTADRSEIRDFSNAIKKAADELSQIRGYHIIVKQGEWAYQTRDVFGYTTSWMDINQGIVLMSKPCSDFRLLVKNIEKYAGLTLDDTSLYSVSIFGKRGQNYTESGQKYFYAYDPNKCRRIMEWIKRNRKGKDKLVAEIKVSDDSEDRLYSMEYETESYGTRRSYLSLEVYTPGGKIKAKTDSRYI